ncbi:hypothetical protein D9619_000669 [Psilocybe cf. subviscida]|uniref:Uncharacterized protein n=1 Tax=Psilocybe cf. subviscida TaxID=2480587 RepID=A0A8H5BDS3_9AGAR|nr:hypothetical protein D9619_000669 [Psilocybe cf. subviscida]
MKIEWASHFNPDGTRRRPPASTMHGWLAKMRGTITGDEDLRSRGMREMKEARAKRKYKAGRGSRQQRSAHTTGKSLFSFLGLGAKKKSSKSTSSSSGRRNELKKPQQRSSTRPTASRQSTGRSGGGGHASRPPTSRKSTGQRSQRPTPTPRPSYASGRRRSDKKN